MGQKSFLFIPDITGFTEFVNSTEITHGQHIISELLEIIIDCDHLQLEVAEVEGDAVLFYKHNEVPSVQDIITQIEQTFLKFHEHLKLYESRRICQCGACISAANLSLKFIALKGEIGFTTVMHKRKPYGENLILAHALLKNQIAFDEYVLFANGFENEIKSLATKGNLGEINHSSGEYQKIGKVEFDYADLSYLKPKIKNPPPIQYPEKSQAPEHMNLSFDLPVQEVYQIISDFNIKEKWITNIDKIEHEKNKVNRVGSKHICVFTNDNATFETVTNDFGGGNQVYGERILHQPVFKDIIIYFILSAADHDKTNIRIEVHYKPIPVIGWLLKPLLKMQIRKNLNKMVSQLKEYVKSQQTANQETVY